MGRKKLDIDRPTLILRAASELFAEFGYEKTTLDGIALRAGIGKGSIYLEFSGKEDILFALILDNKRAQVAQMREIAARRDKPALDLLKAMLVQNIGEVFEAVRRNRRSPEEMAASRERVRALLAPFFEARLGLVAQLLQRAVEEGAIVPNREPSTLAQLMLLALRGVLPPYAPTATRLKLQSQAADLLELIFTGLRAVPGAALAPTQLSETETGFHRHEL